MKMDRVLLVLVSVTIVMQGMLLYQQHTRQVQPASPDADAIQDAPAGSSLDVSALPSKGKSAAKVVLIEFSDYECPFCARHAATVEPELQKQFVDSGKIRYVFANNPLSFHPDAQLLATAAICAGEQGSYWEMHDAIFAQQLKSKSEVLAAAGTLKLDAPKFAQCLDSSREAGQRIEQDTKEAEKLKLDGTPGFALGISDGSGHVHIKKLISGAQPFDVFQKAIQQVATETF